VVESLIHQIRSGVIFLRPLSERPDFQRRYVWGVQLASRLIESILLNVPIPPCYLSQNENYELDVIDGQQRIFSIFRFVENKYPLSGLKVIKELNGLRFHEIPPKQQRQLRTHTLRCVAITNESHPEIKFDVFERLNTNTVPLNAQELRNCVYRGSLISLLGTAVAYEPWLRILGRKQPDVRMRDEELVLRFLAFRIHGVDSYKTPLKRWLNKAAEEGKRYSDEKIQELDQIWKRAIDASLAWFEPGECFRRTTDGRKRALNRALFDLVMSAAARIGPEAALSTRQEFRRRYANLLNTEEFLDLISRGVDHKRRTVRRFELWDAVIGDLGE
ncbi:MAG: DUF262 domain-containing protein, partial [Candidatus Bipolaricaulota bacterium]